QCTTPAETCPEGQVMDEDSGECVTPPVTCPQGQVMDTETGQCTTPSGPPSAPPVVEGTTHHRTPTPPAAVEGERVVRTPAVAPAAATVLPFTGAAGLTWLLTSGAMLLALGGALVAVAGRRRRTT